MKLLPLSKEYLPFLLEVRNHDSTKKFLENNSVFTIDECKNWFSKLKSPWYIIFVDDTPVGYIRTDGDDVGCDIHPKHRRKGYARLAYNEYLKDKDYATLWVFEDNFAKNLYESLGFIENGESKTIRDRKYVRMIWKKPVT
jgi:ribosomal protein S18 acetylase RimI-like enzyme